MTTTGATLWNVRANHLVGRGHAKIGVPQLQLSERVPLRPARLDRHRQPLQLSKILPRLAATKSPAVDMFFNHFNR
jgi:hypothetical protein